MPPDTETPTPLAIPDAAADAFFACGCQRPDCFREGYRIEAVPIIVAAELRRMATELGGYAAPALRARADQLDPQ